VDALPEKGNGPTALKGAVLLLGSLYWEGGLPEQDGQKGDVRKKWRDARLDMSTVRNISSLPICYGRRSASRSGQFTMVFGGKPSGSAKLADLKQTLPSDMTDCISQAGVALMKGEVEALATAEGLWKPSNKTHWTGWGLVAIAVNPHSAFHEAIRAMWITNFSPGPQFESFKYGPTVVDKNGILELALPWASHEMSGLDFCLATPTMPDTPLPSPQQIAEAIVRSSYFDRNADAGIVTADDAEIRRLLGHTS